MEDQQPLRILFVEDLPSDVELAERALRLAGLHFSSNTVETEDAFLHQLRNIQPDLVIADYALPEFDGMRALQLSLAHDHTLPFIILTGSMNEETAVECMKSGAADYVIKQQIARLPLAVYGALEQKKARTEKERTERVLRESEARYKSLFEDSHAVMFLIDPVTLTVVDANPAAVAYYGWSRAELRGMPVEKINTLSSDEIVAELQRAEAEERNQFFFKHRRADGSIRDVEVYSAPIDMDGQQVLYSIVHDITDRVQAEEQVKLNESRLQSLFRISQYNAEDIPELLDFTLHEAIWLTGSKVGYIYYYDEEQRVFSLNTWSKNVMDECDILAAKYINELDSTGIWGEAVRQRKPIVINDFQGPHPLKHGYPDGHIDLYRFLTIPVFSRDQIVAVVGVGNKDTDYTQPDIWQLSLLMDSVWKIVDRKHAEEALLASEEKYRQIVETAQEGIWIIDTETNTSFVNGRMAEMLGYSVSEMIGRSLFDFMDDEARAVARDQIERRRQGQRGQYELVFWRKDGTPLWAFISANPFFDHQGQFKGSQAMVTDITDMKRVQQSEREQRLLAQALADVALALNTTLDLDTVLSRILEQLTQVVPYDAAYVLLIEDGVAAVAQCRGFEQYGVEDVIRQLRIPVDDLPDFRWMMDNREPFMIPNTREFDEWVDLEPTRWANSFIATPILREQQVLGFLALLDATPYFFTGDHTPRLRAFANQAALALHNAQLYRQIGRHADELEQRVIQRTAELNTAKERIEAILNSSSDSIILCTPDGIIDQVNAAFNATFRALPEGPLAQPLTRLVRPEYASALERTFQTVIETQQPQRLEVTTQSTASTGFDADMVLSPVIREGNQMLGVVCSLRDITERKRTEGQLRQLLEHEMELGELKSRYVSMAAHDLRNPLAVIQTSISLLQNYSDRLTSEQKDSKLSAVQNSIKIMVELLDDILTIGRVEAGKVRFSPQRVDLVALCEAIMAEQKQATGYTHPIVMTHHGGCDHVHADPKLLRYILVNLLSNALKYSSAGTPVRLDIDCAEASLQIVIQDQGIGIPESHWAYLFEAFHRAENVGKTPGTGLGMAIVKQSVDLHGGTIAFETEEGSGTTFTVALPQSVQEKA